MHHVIPSRSLMKQIVDALKYTLFLILYGCGSSILSDSPRDQYWPPITTAFQEFQNDTRDETLTIVLLDSQRFQGVLIKASPDSIVWSNGASSIRLSYPIHQVDRIERTSYTIPMIIATSIFCFVGALIGEIGGSESGGAHPSKAPARFHLLLVERPSASSFVT